MIRNPTEVKGEIIVGYAGLILRQYRYKKHHRYHNLYNVSNQKKKKKEFSCETGRKLEDEIHIPGVTSGLLFWNKYKFRFKDLYGAANVCCRYTPL